MHVNQTECYSLTSERDGLPLKHWAVWSKLYVPSPFIWYRPQPLQKKVVSNYRSHLPPIKKQYIVTNIQTTSHYRFTIDENLNMLFISVFNQIDAQNLFQNKFCFMPLHVSSTCWLLWQHAATIPNWYSDINVTFCSVNLARTIWLPDDGPRTEIFRSIFNVLI